jgi:fumarylacetoacetase
MLDYELEVGVFVGRGNSLLNDWSARDIQAWEYQPLGPFLAKSFATSVSPWIVTLEALAPFRTAALQRSADDPGPLPYLSSPTDAARGGLDVRLDVTLASQRMREHSVAPVVIARSSLSGLYWTIAQLLTHHASNGCNLRPGDLLGTGTVSGAGDDSCGCLLELTANGRQPVRLPGGETRSYLADGDEVTLRGYCERNGFRRIGLGTCRGIITRASEADQNSSPA